MAQQQQTLPVMGMTCANCANTIERNVGKLAGIGSARVNFAAEQLNVNYDTSQLQLSDIVKQVKRAGYSVAQKRVEIPVTGMSCANCAANIERALKRKVAGVVDASVNFASEHATVEYIPTLTGLDDIVAAIRKAGYDAVIPDDADSSPEDAEMAARQADVRDQTRKFIVGLIFTIPLFVLSMGRNAGLFGAWAQMPIMNWVFFALATPVQFYTGWDYY